MAMAAAALLPESFSVLRPIDKACLRRSASIGADGVDADEVRGELLFFHRFFPFYSSP